MDFGLTIKIPNKGAKENSHKRRCESSLGEFGESLEQSLSKKEFWASECCDAISKNQSLVPYLLVFKTTKESLYKWL
ncbi:hypothetical protein [Campylobacter hyointestinalis]|uniref:hypothetical protein n=1 Tax=Campylobacter hyointestinalis TaxID=198 RepID=UPI00116175C7|nr:hypothetical protein [Campylobacter hyointestinalis]